MPHPDPVSYPPLDGRTIYAIGDIHGCDDLLNEVHARIDAEDTDGLEIYLGDYIDRGPDTAGVIQMLIDRAMNRDVIFILGNHEFLAQEFLAGKIAYEVWQRVGAAETLRSYGVDAAGLSDEEIRTAFSKSLPIAHQFFFELLRPSFTSGDYFFTHAGVRPGIALEAQTGDDLMWIRREFLDCTDAFGKIIVHGHTPVELPEFKANRINIDTGAFATGRLTCLALDGDGARLLR